MDASGNWLYRQPNPLFSQELILCSWGCEKHRFFGAELASGRLGMPFTCSERGGDLANPGDEAFLIRRGLVLGNAPQCRWWRSRIQAPLELLNSVASAAQVGPDLP